MMMVRAGLLMVGLAMSATVRCASAEYPYMSCFQVASRLHDVPLELLLAVAATESNWDPDARSTANAHGIMQIQWPGTARHLGVKRLSELYNPCLNIDVGARYLRQLLDETGGDVERTLAAYNYGPARISGSARLPPGARKYVAAVKGRRDRILESAERAGSTAASAPVSQTMHFDSGSRAGRYARAMAERVRRADFVIRPLPDGSYAVDMRVKSGGLTMSDRSMLVLLGWPASGRK